MDLETFIAETLRQIVKGVQTAQQHEDCKEARINPKGEGWHKSARKNSPTDPAARRVEFDVAVIVSEGSEKQGKGSIGVASVFGIGGQASSTTASSSISRIKFTIPVALPSQ